MRAHINAARDEAERLIRKVQGQTQAPRRAPSHAASSATAEQDQPDDSSARNNNRGDIPPSGWQPINDDLGNDSLAQDLQTMLGLVRALSPALPLEVSQPLRNAIKELLVSLRELIDWYIDRMADSIMQQPSAPDANINEEIRIK